MNNFKAELLKALEYYKKWKKQSCYCPALGCNVLITNRAWHHLVGNKGYRQRNPADKYRRMKLLPYAKQVLEDSHTIQDVRTVQGRMHYAMDAVIPIEQNGSQFLRKIRVVVYEDVKGNKIFLSVMDKK